MKIIKKFLCNLVWSYFILNNIIVNSIFCNFLSIECSGWSFNRTTESIVIVALMISHFNNLVFFHIGRVYHNFIMDWTSWCCFRVFVSNHIEIEILVTIIIYDITLYHCSWLWILFNLLSNFKESCDIVFVHQYIQYFRVIVFIKFLDCIV